MNGIQESLKLEYVQSVKVLTGTEKGKTREIILANGGTTLVDDEDYERLSKYKWFLLGSRKVLYVMRNKRDGKRKYLIRMHREILGLTSGDGNIVDHINLNRRDNRKTNLRIVSKMINRYNCKMRSDNTSGFRGVHYRKRGNCIRWQASICKQSKQIHIGYFSTDILAAKAYDMEAIKQYGSDAILNFPKET